MEENKNKGLITTIIVLSGIIVILLATILIIKSPFVSDVKETEEETFETTTLVETSMEEETTIPDVKEEEKPKVPNVEKSKYTGYKNHVNIEYPLLTGMEDKDLESKLNYKIQKNALSIIQLYPISTAIQKLNIEYEIKHIDENTITIIYTGDVKGVDLGKTNTANNNETTINSAALSEYYQNIINQANINNNAPVTIVPDNNVDNNINNNTSNNNTYEPTNGAHQSSGYIVNSSKGLNNESHTSDGGPTVKENKGPGAPKEEKPKSNVVNPNQINSTGTAPSTGTSGSNNSAEAPFSSTTGNNTSGNSNLPISGFSNTNTSPSTISQKIYYVNTIDLKTCKDISLSDYVSDFDALSKYIRSSKVEFINVDKSNRSAVRKYVNLTVQSRYAKSLKEEADFCDKDLKHWPKHFSYKDEDGNIYISVKLSSKLGNYAIVKYKVNNK